MENEVNTEIETETELQKEEQTFPVATSTAEAIFQIFAHVGKAMKTLDVFRELSKAEFIPLKYREELTSEGAESTIASKVWQLSNNYKNVLDHISRGTYIIHPDWNGKPLSEQTRKRKTTTSANKDVNISDIITEPVIPCYGIRWDRELVSWEKQRSGVIMGQAYQDEKPVNFAKQIGTYVLYDATNVVYVGRTISETIGMYGRIRSHVYNPRRAHRWTHFSWFGLKTVNEDSTLGDNRADLATLGEIVLMETLLIEMLNPAFNDKGGDSLGVKYEQVIDPAIQEKNRQQLRDDIASMLPRLMQEAWSGKLQ